MARYIDADALTEHIQKLKVVTDDWFGMGIARGIERAETAIQMQPTVDVAPKSEVAREIFKEILNKIGEYEFDALMNKNNYAIMHAQYLGLDIMKLKKKYIGGQDDST